MIDSQSAQKTIVDLADKIRVFDKGAAIRLGLLARALDGKDATPWVFGDIYQMIDPDSIVEGFRSTQTRGRFIDILEMLRNTIILAPIMITWFSISQATEQYHTLLSEFLKSRPNDVSQPFLYLWQEGFGGRLPSYLTLSSIGIVDAALIAFILVLTLITFSMDRTNTLEKEREAFKFRAELTHALAGASLLLAGKRKPEPITAGDNLEVVAQKYDAMTQATNAKFDGMVQKVLAQFNTMTGQVMSQFADTTKRITDQFNAVSKKMDAQLQAGNTYLSTLNTFVQGFDTLSKDMQESAKLLKDTNNNLATSINGLVTPAKEMAKQQKDLADAVKDSVALLQSSAKTLSDLGKGQNALAQDMRDTLDTMNIAVEKAVQLASSVGNFTTQQGLFLKQLEQERDAQRQLALLMSDASVNVKEALASMGQGGLSLRGIAHDMKDLVDLQRSSDNSSVVQTYTSAAHTIERSGQALNASAVAIYDASQKLADAIDELENRLATTK